MKGTHIGEFEELVLLIVIILKEEAYVLRIQQELKVQVNRSISMGALHSTLSRLEKKGFLASQMDRATDKRGGRRKRIYDITAIGSTVVQEAKEQRRSLWDQIPSYAFQLGHA